jgi:Tol biopolymer transport system component
LDIYISEKDGRQLKDPSIFDKSLNGKMHDGPASFNKSGDFIAFTKNNYDTKRNDRIVELQIFFSYMRDGKWSSEEAFYLNNVNYSVGHPSLSPDGNIMYFSSDMPGGFGGADIYRVEKSGGSWGKPENLGNKVNTEGNELFPFYESNNEVLFFASDGRFGLGGLDIFFCSIDGDQTSDSRNAGTPVNTKYDDFGVVTDDKLTTGYFSSNRSGGSGDDDIYSLDILKDMGIPKKVRGIAKDVSGNAIPVTFITMRDDSAKTLDTLTTGEDGSYLFFVDSDENFTLEGEKQKFENGETAFNSYGTTYVIIADVILLKEKEDVVLNELDAIDNEIGKDLGKIADLKPFYFDFDKSIIRADSDIVLD